MGICAPVVLAKTGPHISSITFFTPFALLAHQSSKHTAGYSAQQAQLDQLERFAPNEPTPEFDETNLRVQSKRRSVICTRLDSELPAAPLGEYRPQ